MGVDVVFKARPFVEIGDDFIVLRAHFRATFPDDMPEYPVRFPDLVWDDYEPVPTMEVRSTSRYYGPGYERGHWPDIRVMGDWLAIELGELAELRYGGDADDSWEALRQWGKVRTELDAHWEQHENRPYEEFWRQWRERHP